MYQCQKILHVETLLEHLEWNTLTQTVEISQGELYAPLPWACCVSVSYLHDIFRLFHQAQMTLVCGRDGMAAEMDVLVIITKGTSVPSRQGIGVISGQSLFQGW